MRKHWLYLKAVVRHKWFVFLACFDMGVPIWWAILHDWDKFTPAMWGPYVDYFYGSWRGPNPDRNLKAPLEVYAPFERAWNGHQKLNKHHWQYWVRLGDDGTTLCLAMPDRHRREMVADWMGAGRAYVKGWNRAEPLAWYEQNKHKMQLHTDTLVWVERQLRRQADLYDVERHGIGYLR